MKSHPLIFSAPMVRALLENRKTQTRRIVKPQPRQMEGGLELVKYDDAWCWLSLEGDEQCIKEPYATGDHIWVKETWADVRKLGLDKDLFAIGVAYRADCDADSLRIAKEYGAKWRPSIFMPRWASRITLEVEAVRVERLQDITEDDAIAEGYSSQSIMEHPDAARIWYRNLWNSINGLGSWDLNRWVRVITFRKL